MRVAAEYFRKVSLQRFMGERGGPGEALSFAQDHAGTFWSEAARQALGESMVANGLFGPAQEHLEQISGPRAVRAAAFIEAATRQLRSPPVIAP